MNELIFNKMAEILQGMVRIPSFSREEGNVADFLEGQLVEMGFRPHRLGNNLWLDSVEAGGYPCVELLGLECVAAAGRGDAASVQAAGQSKCGESLEKIAGKPVILLNAHIDTVHPAASYTRDPFSPDIENGIMYGLGTNDDGASVVALLAAYIDLISRPQQYRLIWSATAEEEVCGKGGIEAIFPEIGDIALGIMGEPTKMEMAIAERGLMVLDCTAAGKSGHAAREEGINAIYKALPDIEWFRTYRFQKVSPYLGLVKMSVTQINAGVQHNIVPDKCGFVVDVRSNGMYSNPELLSLIKSSVSCDVKERSTRLGSSHISETHPIVLRAKSMGIPLFGSATTSNQTLSPFTTVKIGPGDSARSHTADEYILLDEIRHGIDTYVRLLDGFGLE